MEQTEAQKPRRKKSPLMEMIESILIAVLLALIIRTFIAQPFIIPSGSMEPTLQVGDRILVSKINYKFSEPQRGDIVVFKFPLDPSKDFVKRLIGKAGDKVEVRNGKLYLNGRKAPEEYLPEGLEMDRDFGPVEVPQGHYMMLGDNRNNSDDSRSWGPLPENLVVGKAVAVYWPSQRIMGLGDK